MGRKIILCDCLGSQTIDAHKIAEASGLECSKVYTSLCTTQSEAAAREIASGNVILACQQERSRFEAIAEEIEADLPGFVDIRDRAGWSDGTPATAKMAALAAEATLPSPLAKSVDVISEGTCLILGEEEVALKAARNLKDVLGVTVLLAAETDVAPEAGFDLVRGELRNARGALGGFEVALDNLSMPEPGGRGVTQWSDPRNGARSHCDLILDLRGDTALFPAPEKREGYLRADPKRPEAVAEAILTASQMIGTFEKPLYVRHEPTLCAHSRAEQTACTKCLDICPTGAISPAGEHVSVDPMICAGCGACAALCPSGAMSYDAPPVESLFRRLQVLAETYRKAGGTAPKLLVHDAPFGSEMISLCARHGAGLPADVIPIEIDTIAGFGHAEAMAALGVGFQSIFVLLAPKTERDTPQGETLLANALAGDLAMTLLDIADPLTLTEAVSAAPSQRGNSPVLPMGTRRQVTRLVAKGLHPENSLLELPQGAPYGAVLVDTDSCTLCLSCVSLCPSGALGDNPDMPQLRFQEDACLQCGLCANICPEQAIELKPQLDLSDTALQQRVLHEEEPFACVECGALFGVKSTVEKIVEKLAGKHSMFASADAGRMIQMCDNCRIQAQFHSKDNPFTAAERPRVRTTDDYFTKRKDH